MEASGGSFYRVQKLIEADVLVLKIREVKGQGYIIAETKQWFDGYLAGVKVHITHPQGNHQYCKADTTLIDNNQRLQAKWKTMEAF